MNESTEYMPLWLDFCSKAAPLASFALYIAPMTTILQITRDRSVGSLPLLPYTTMIANNFLWTVYGVLKNESRLLVANGTGLVLSVAYFIQFVRLAPSKAATLPGSSKRHTQFVLGLVFAVLYMVTSPTLQHPAEVLGFAGMMFNMAMFASPLAALKSVILSKSAKSIPLPFTIASLANNYFWGTVGYVDMKDFNVYFPAFVGFVFGLAQLGLKVWFKDGPNNTIGMRKSRNAKLLKSKSSEIVYNELPQTTMDNSSIELEHTEGN